jgi:hypothetical protein
MPTVRKTTQRHITHAGYSIPAVASELGMPEGLIRSAVQRGEIEVVPFGGLRRIPPREVDRLRELFRPTKPAEAGRAGPSRLAAKENR